MTTPYVILKHSTGASVHFDLLLDLTGSGPLQTWQSETDPRLPGAAFHRLPDHRRHYWTYEGEIAGGRGQVERIAQGICQVRTSTNTTIEVDFHPQQPATSN
jgi:hypothetical protein